MMAGSDRDRDESNEDYEAPDRGHQDETLDLDESTDRLALEDEDRLPWLDSDDDDYPAEADNRKVFGLVLLGLIALATIVGGIWWATHRNPDPELVADGSTIPAPSGAYREAPKDPGGKTFDGTGDTAFAVSEGQSRPARLGETPAPVVADPSPRPVIAPAPAQGAGSLPSLATGPSAGAPPSAGLGGPGVQVGAYSSRAAAEAAWSRLTQQHSALSGQRYRIVEGKADIGTVFRLQAIPGDAAAAQALCNRLKAGGLTCQVK